MNVAMIWVMKTEGRKGVRPLIFRTRELGGQNTPVYFEECSVALLTVAIQKRSDFRQ